MKNIVLSAVIAATSLACSNPAPKPKDERVRVTVVSPVQRDMPVQIKVIGSVAPISSVAVRAQVGGQLMKVWFHKGQDVRRGDRLFTIHPLSYPAAPAAGSGD